MCLVVHLAKPAKSQYITLYTNRILYKMNLVPSPMCTFCGDHEETLEHLLISCTYTKTFWLSVISWLNTHNMRIDKLDEVTILFGISDNNPGNCLLNHIIILGKYTIYSCRCKNIKPSLSLLKARTTETDLADCECNVMQICN